jgi:hypothetical protein
MGKFFDDKPVNPYKFKGIYWYITVCGAAITAAFSACKPYSSFFLLIIDGRRNPTVYYGIGI